SRSEPSAAAAARIASISQWAVGSRSASVRLPARAITAPSRTTTQPTGTSPASAAARASSSARSMKEAMEEAMLVDPAEFCYQAGPYAQRKHDRQERAA